MKFVLSFCFFIAVTSLTWGKSINWGKRKPGDTLLHRENIVRYPIKGYTQEIYVAYPRLGVRAKANVTAVYVFDRFTNSSGAIPTRGISKINSNKANFNSTIVILKSQLSKGINSTVEFFGKYF